VGSGDWIKEWDQDWSTLPQQIAAWRTGFLSYSQHGWMEVPWVRFAYASTSEVTLTLTTDTGQVMNITVPSSGGNVAKYWTWLPANKFKMMEWTADAGGSALTVYAADCELAVSPWGLPPTILRPFSGKGFGTEGSST